MTEAVKYIGLDVHKETIVAVADGTRGRGTLVGTVPNEDDAVRKLVKRLTGPGAKLQVCSRRALRVWPAPAANRAGAELHRHRPFDDAARPGDHVKTDRRDAMTLARLLRAGELTAIWVPDEAHEAVRDLIRASAQRAEDATGAKQTVAASCSARSSFGGKGTWTKMYWRWLSEQRFDFPHQQLASPQGLFARQRFYGHKGNEGVTGRTICSDQSEFDPAPYDSCRALKGFDGDIAISGIKHAVNLGSAGVH
jgi:transposase